MATQLSHRKLHALSKALMCFPLQFSPCVKFIRFGRLIEVSNCKVCLFIKLIRNESFVFMMKKLFSQSRNIITEVIQFSRFFHNKSATFSTVNDLILVFINSREKFSSRKLFNFSVLAGPSKRKKKYQH